MLSGIEFGDKPTYRLRELDLQAAGGAEVRRRDDVDQQ
jgi:hypothetical protein